MGSYNMIFGPLRPEFCGILFKFSRQIRKMMIITYSSKAGGNETINVNSNTLTLNTGDTITAQVFCTAAGTIQRNSLLQLEYLGT